MCGLEVLGDGVYDAVILTFFDTMRDANSVSTEWLVKRRGKIEGGMSAIAESIGCKTYAVGDQFSLGDIAAGTTLAYLEMPYPKLEWRLLYTYLALYSDNIEQRD